MWKITFLCLLLFVSECLSSLSLESKLRKRRSLNSRDGQPNVFSFEDQDHLSENILRNFDSHHNIKKREAENSTKSNSSIITKTSFLDDSHNQLVVHWAGEDVIICLAKDASQNSTSTLYISNDYGGTFHNVSDKILMKNKQLPTLDQFFNHNNNNGRFIFTDTINKYIFTTKNYGVDFRAINVPFVPDEITFDPHSNEIVVAFEKETTKQEMWLSQDFGQTWTKSHQYVKSYSWDDAVVPARLYLERKEPNDHTVLISSDSLFLDPKDTKVEIEDIEEFDIKDEYIFATKRIKTSGEMELLISYKRGVFKTAQFPNKNPAKHFHVADVTDGQIFVCIAHNEYLTNLYIGNEPVDDSSPEFSLSLERIVFFKPNMSWPDSWLNDVTGEAFVDLHRVDGLRGVYIASQLKSDNRTNGKLNLDEVVSLVTYDQGAEWTELEPPDFDDEEQPIYCKYTTGKCALHISQRLSELYPVTRAVPIMSKKSAVGIVLATGTVNSSLKGNLGVYISTDGAVKWRQVLKGNYLYNFGDHGGLIVATKSYKIGDSTNELIYSTDEGKTWHTYAFMKDKIRVLGLMTEPGENTTVFFIFGSVSNKTKHSWVLIKVDLRSVLGSPCSTDDYKSWSPWDSKPGRHCLMGRKDVYERRIATRLCYNGKDYKREINPKRCICERTDFECDYGYKLDVSKNDTCIRDEEVTLPNNRLPCNSGEGFYSRSRGYRKVPGNICHGGISETLQPMSVPCAVRNESQFLLVAKRDSILRVNLNNFAEKDHLPLPHSEAIIAVDFDVNDDSVFWSDVNRDQIMRLHLDGNSEPEVLVSNNLLSVEGLAFDWMSKNLYFCDGAGSKIDVIRTNVKNVESTRKEILKKPDVEKPRGIAVHPAKGYLFWSDWSSDKPAIGRSLLDGSNVTYLVENPKADDYSVIKWPNGLAIDYVHERLYWVDASLDHIVSVGFDGEGIKPFLKNDQRVGHPFAAAVYNDILYWDDWITRSIYMVAIDSDDVSKSASVVLDNSNRLMDLKVYGPQSQRGENICSATRNHNCSHVCLAVSDKTSPCSCPTGFNLTETHTCVCSNGLPINEHGTCGSPPSKEVLKCPPLQFACIADDRCVPATFRCDFDKDCSDGSDEANCEKLYPKCDEPNKFKCANDRCIMKTWVCDNDDDCHDGSDEKNCTATDKPFTCKPNEFKCASPTHLQCISQDYVCNGSPDCGDNSDENEDLCKNRTCPDWKFKCGSGECIMSNWACDGDSDCKDGSDEKNCSHTISPTTLPPSLPTTDCGSHSDMFKCLTSDQCLPITWLCDHVPDCNDGSDEMNCEGDGHTTTTTQRTVTFKPELRCPDDHWQCDTGECIWQTSLCDGFQDCPGKEDEQVCHNETQGGCPKDHIRCGNSNMCVKKSKLCNGVNDCGNNMDEMDCHSGTPSPSLVCNSGQFKCPEGMCIPLFKRCNKVEDCYDGSDESSCTNFKTIYQVAGISADPTEIEHDHFTVEWWVDQGVNEADLEFLPSFCDIHTGNCHNCTLTKERKFSFGHSHIDYDITPNTKYSVTVYAVYKNTSYPPAIYINVTTAEGESSPPLNVDVKQNTTDQLCISWKKPVSPNGRISMYKVYFQPPVPPAVMDSVETGVCISNKQSDPVFVDGEEYKFWVAAENSAGKSANSEVATYKFNSQVPEVSKLTITQITENSVSANWSSSGDSIYSYSVTLEVSNPVYPLKKKVPTSETKITVRNLAPGTNYKLTVVPNRREVHGASTSIRFTTKGEPLKKVRSLNTTVLDSKNEVNVTWEAPANSTGLIYGIYCGKSTKEVAEKGALFNTTATSATITDLESCETYLVDVGVVGPNGIGPLTETPRLVYTSMSRKSAPKSLRIVDVNEDDVTITLSWRAPCTILSHPIGYNITLEEVTTHKLHGLYNISFSNAPQVKRNIKINYGGSYRITVSTSFPEGGSSLPVTFEGPPIPYPQQLKLCSECSVVTVYWTEPKLPKKVTDKGKISYVVWLSKDESFKDKSTQKHKTSENSLAFDNISEEDVYYVAISVQDAEGLESPRSPAIPLQQMVSSSQISISTSNALGIGITVFVIVVMLVSALGVFVVRHKRLQTSFLNFASSHYSTQSGAATFQQTIEEEQDSPVIRGFSDDEPLLIA